MVKQILTFDGSTLAVTGAITGSSDLTLQDDLILDSDAAVLSFGEDNEIALTHVADTGLLLTDSGGTPTLQFHDANESISSDGTDLILAAGADINLTATTDINIPANVGLTFGNDAEKIEGDGTDLTIAGNNINLTAVADVVVPANVGVLFGSGEKIEGDNTDLTITSGAKINLTATSDVVVPANVGITFGTGEKIEGDSTDLTVTSGAKINLTATSDVHLPNNVGMIFGDSAEKIEGDGTDLTISGNNIKLTAATDVIIPTNVGLHFTDANEKIESDGSNIKITSGGTEFTIPASDGSNGQALVTNGSGVLSFAAAGSSNPSSADGEALGSASLEWSDLFLADASTIQFGADQDVLLTHVADTGLLLSGTNVIQFNDASQNIGAPSATVLDINATDEIELNATLVDINGNVEISGTATTTGVHTFTAVPVFPNNTIETADIQADAITNAEDS